MELSKLQINLRPRPNAQALDLGFALLRAHAKDTYLAWLILFLPCVAVDAVLSWLLPHYEWLWYLLPWWIRPLLERAPLYVLSRKVFGENATWKEALRAWPSQLGGGWFRLLTWWRLFVPGRGLYQPIWQLEGARGKAAAERRSVLRKGGTGWSASLFGIACANFEMVLELGLMTFIGIFLSSDDAINPFSFLDGTKVQSPFAIALAFACYAFAAGIVGPIYTACCFTQYLNRRATLEAWDIEIVLRQLKPPPAKKRLAPILVAALACITISLGLHSSSARAANASAPNAAAGKCEPPDWVRDRVSDHPDHHDAEQKKLRDEVARLFSDDEDLRGYRCEESWVRKIKAEKKPEKPEDKDSFFFKNAELIARLLKIAVIIFAAGLVLWALYRYREKLGFYVPEKKTARATEVGGFDIRPESLPEDVVADVRRLWQAGKRREALALLYRATLSRLANREGVNLDKGATEGDCLRSAETAMLQGRLDAAKFGAVAAAIELWQQGAYAGRWPDDGTLSSRCAAWDTAFGFAASASPETSP